MKANVELDKLLEVARNAAPVEDPKENTICVKMEQPVKIGILRDKAFSFYYPENLEALEQAGAGIG